MKLLYLAFAISLPATAVAAQEPADRASRVALAEYGACIAKASPDLARRAVTEQWDRRQFYQYDLLRLDGCWKRGRVRFHPANMRAAIANALILRDGSIDPAQVAAAPPLAYQMPEPLRTTDSKGKPLSAEKLESQRKAIASKLNWIAIGQFGECVARANPGAVPALVRTEPGSDAEVAALKAFGPQLPACLPKGVTIELDRSSLRNSLAVAYYRLGTAPRAVSGAAR